LRLLGILMLLVFIASFIPILGGVVGAAAVYDYFAGQLPDFTEIKRLDEDTEATFETTKIYAWGDDPDGDGFRELVLIYEVIDPLGGDRQWLALDQIPRSLVDATVAIEDKTFWTNRGFDIQGIARAFYEYVVLGGRIQG